MMIVWNEQSIRWFRNASEYTGYNKKLSQILLEYIPNRNTLCDMGCGAALIDFELAKTIDQVTCIDISQEAICAVEQMAREQGITNLSTSCMDGFDAEGQWETVLALFHGGADLVSKYLPLAKDQLILVTHGTQKGGFGPEHRKIKKSFGFKGVMSHLDEMGIKYHFHEYELEHGQPFADLQEVEAFVKAYSVSLEKEELDTYLKEHLVHTGEERYPYYLPKKKHLALFVVRRDENENV